jgi:hypothetical protein
MKKWRGGKLPATPPRAPLTCPDPASVIAIFDCVLGAGSAAMGVNTSMNRMKLNGVLIAER